MVRKHVGKSRLILLGTISLLTGAFWITSETVRQYKTDEITPQYEKQITQLSPVLDTEALDKIAAKKSIPVNFGQLEPIPYSEAINRNSQSPEKSTNEDIPEN